MHLRREVNRGEVTNRAQRAARATMTAGPGLGWLLVFFVAPLLLIVATSFLSRGELGTVERPWTLENYRRLAGYGELGFDSLYPRILGRSVILAALTAGLSLMAALPLAFFIARLPGRWRVAGLMLVLIPFWTNLLIRTYAWQVLLAPGSWLSRLAVALGILRAEEGLYPGLAAVLMCLVCDYLPFVVLPLYASVEKIDWTLAEAAMDLGAARWNVFRHALLPQIRPGLLAGGILVLLPALGQFVIPDLLGGAKVALLGNIIQQQFGPGLDWPFGSAMAVVGLVCVMAGVWLVTRRRNGEEIEIL